MIKKRSLVLYLFGLPADLVCTLIAILLWPFQKGLGLRFERNVKSRGLWVLTLDVGWLPKDVAAITIAPHVVFFRTGRHFGQGWSVLQEHEHKHVEQYEVAALTGSALAALSLVSGAPWLSVLPMWAVAPWLLMLAGYAAAWLHGGDPYRDSINEESAYALSADRSNR